MAGNIAAGGAIPPTLDKYQFTAVGSGTIVGRYVDDNGCALLDSNGDEVFTLTVSTSAFSVFPNLPAGAVGARIKVTGTVHLWSKDSDGNTVGAYTDAIALGDLLPTGVLFNLGRVAG